MRDARAQLDKDGKTLIKYQCEASYYKYVQLGFNYLNAIIDLLEIENDQRLANGETDFIDIDAAKEDLKKYAHAYFNDIKLKQCENPEEQQKENEEAECRANFKFGLFFHDVILPFYAQYRPESLSEDTIKLKLTLDRNFANMKMDPYVVATLSRHPVVPPLQRRTKHAEHIDIVELELPMTELTDSQKKLYVAQEQLNWFKGQSDLAQALID